MKFCVKDRRPRDELKFEFTGVLGLDASSDFACFMVAHLLRRCGGCASFTGVDSAGGGGDDDREGVTGAFLLIGEATGEGRGLSSSRRLRMIGCLATIGISGSFSGSFSSFF